MPDLTPDQLQQLADLGINTTHVIASPIGTKQSQRHRHSRLWRDRDDVSKSPILPLLSISGLTLISFSGLILLKSKASNQSPLGVPNEVPELPNRGQDPQPSQVPKSIQHFLLTSQQEFSKALQIQTNTVIASEAKQSQLVEYLNSAIVSATQAIQEFPTDYRGYQQRAAIYQSLLDSKPELIDPALADLTTAFKLNPNSAEVSRNLASLFAKKGDGRATIQYLIQTVALEPTKAQNFYDLAKIQQQVGLVADALKTYQQLLPLIPDPTQQQTIQNEILALQNLVNQSGNVGAIHESPSPTTTDGLDLDSRSLQAQLLTDTGLIIAGPETDRSVAVANQTDTNALSGTATLSAGSASITLQNENLTSDSQVYVAIVSGGKNQNLQVLSKTDSSFTIGLDSPINEDIEFKYWIIN